MDITVTVADEVAASYGDTYGYPEGSKVDLATFCGGSLATYMENAHVGRLASAAEQTAKQPFVDAQKARDEAAKPEPVDDTEPADDPKPNK